MKEYDLDQPMDKLIDIVVKKFGAVEFEKVSVGDVSVEVLQIKDMQRYIDKLMDKTRAGQKISLPLWAKIWPASVILGYSLTRFPLNEGSSFLEIGAGVAVNGLVLAKRGFDVTITDIDQDALLFSRINALKNGLGDRVTIARTDSFSDSQGRRFDYIVACGMLYDEIAFEPLADYINDHLAEETAAEVFLAVELKREARRFFSSIDSHFAIMKSSAKYTDQESREEKIVNLFRLKRK